MTPLYANRTDDNHRPVVDELRAIMPEASVFDASGTGGGFPDLVVGWRGMNYLFELKDGSKSPGKRKLTKAQAALHARWQGHIAVVHSAAEIAVHMLRHLYDRR